MSAPKPRHVAALIERLEEYLHDPKRCGKQNVSGVIYNCIGCEYEWAHGASYDRSVGETVKVSGSGSDPTGEVVVGKFDLRRAMVTAHRKTKAALDSLEAAQLVLEKAMGKADTRHSPQIKHPPRSAMVSAEDLWHAHQAAARRRERGEGFGSA